MPRDSTSFSRGATPGFDPRAIRSDGHVAASGAAQFIPFAALRGLADLFRDREDLTTAEPFHDLTPEECLELSQAVAALRRGQRVTCAVYDGRRYVTMSGRITRIELPHRIMYLDSERVLLDNVRSLCVTDADRTHLDDD